jgi:polysaccharide pyruvyl transferase WcaK-like protein
VPDSGRPTIYLIGTSGFPNYGDELITASWLRYYAEAAPDADVWLDTYRPGPSAVLFHDLHPRLRCTDTLYHALANVPGDDTEGAMRFTAEVVDAPFIVPREVLGHDILRQADVIHVLGGGYINAQNPRTPGLLAAAAAVAGTSGCRLAITGAGLTPGPKTGSDLFAETLNRFDVVDVRDAASKKLLEDLGVTTQMSGDDAFIGLGPSIVSASRNLPVVNVCIQEDLSEVSLEVLADYTCGLLEEWDMTDAHIGLLECSPPEDLHVAPLLQERLPNLELFPFDRLWREGMPVRPGQRWISTRFHPHLVAAAASCWGVALPVNAGYYANKHQSLLDLGSGWVMSDLETFPEPPSRPLPPFGGNLPKIQAAKRAVAASVLEGVL